eukprot:4248839-Pleurochrysis_carterae.AAC.1
MLACGVPPSANDRISYSPTHDRPLSTKPLLNLEVGYPTKYRYHVTPTGYLPTIGLLTRRLPTIYIKQPVICGYIAGELKVLPGDCLDVYFVELFLL